jgi:predicted RNA-binding protein YlqC (UPF0109 family)
MAVKLIEYIVHTLVDKPQLVKIEEISEPEKYLVKVYVVPHDVRKLIGREGRIFRALRSVVNIMNNSLQPIEIVIDSLKD